jgi:hypothetical protein
MPGVCGRGFAQRSLWFGTRWREAACESAVVQTTTRKRRVNITFRSQLYPETLHLQKPPLFSLSLDIHELTQSLSNIIHCTH